MKETNLEDINREATLALMRQRLTKLSKEELIDLNIKQLALLLKVKDDYEEIKKRFYKKEVL